MKRISKLGVRFQEWSANHLEKQKARTQAAREKVTGLDKDYRETVRNIQEKRAKEILWKRAKAGIDMAKEERKLARMEKRRSERGWLNRLTRWLGGQKKAE